MVGRRTAIIGHNGKRRKVACDGGDACHSVSCGNCGNCGNYSNCFKKSLIRSFSTLRISWLDIVFILWNLLLPRGCAGCEIPDVVLCEDCCNKLKRWQRAPFPSAECGYRYSCGIYAGAVRRAILLWKDHSDVACDKIFSSLLSNLVLKVMSELFNCSISLSNENSLLVIPMPSSNSSTRRRGRKHTLPLSKAVAQSLCNIGIPSCSANIIKMRSNVTTKSVQSSGSRGRSHRAANAFRINFGRLKKCKSINSQQYQAIIVDDIVTTGSTMSSCVAALQEANINVLAVFSLACVLNIGDGTVDYCD